MLLSLLLLLYAGLLLIMLLLLFVLFSRTCVALGMHVVMARNVCVTGGIAVVAVWCYNICCC